MTDYISKIATPDGEMRTIGGDFLSAEWTLYRTVLFFGSLDAKSTTNLDLTTVIPSDGFQYELLLDVIAVTSSNQDNKYISIELDSVKFGEIRTYNTSSLVSEHTGILPLTADNRNIKLDNTGDGGTSAVQIYLRAYRRLGTNTGLNSEIIKSINNNLIGGKIADGQWTHKSLLIQGASGNTFPTGMQNYKLYDISGYLPEDSAYCDYLVQVLSWGGTGSNTGNRFRLLAAFTDTPEEDGSQIVGGLYQCLARVAKGFSRQSSALLVCKAGVTHLGILNPASTANGTSAGVGIQLGWFRRLGTNK